MRFKDFFREETSGTDKGLMGFPVPSTLDVPSNGPGKKFPNLGSVAGQTPRGNGGGGGGASPLGAMFMKKMRKEMEKK